MTQSTRQQSLLTFKSGGWVIVLSAILMALILLQMFWPALTGHQVRHIGDGVNVSSYGFDLRPLLVPRDAIVASGMPRDGLHVLTNPPMQSVAENSAIDKLHGHLVSKDLVVGVAAGTGASAEARAYPLRNLEIHEIVNDTLAGRPLVVTYNPLCASIAVFERPSANTEFGFSGLLYQSNLLMYDRPQGTQDSREPSLWSQLQFRAIAGPAAATGQSLTLVPFELTTWADWKQRHPNTLILTRDAAVGQGYSYGNYFATDEIKFPVDPLWTGQGLARKTRCLAVRAADGWALYILPNLTEKAGAAGHWSTMQSGVPLEFAVDPGTQTARVLAPPGTPAIPCFLFAWYAQHPKDPVLAR